MRITVLLGAKGDQWATVEATAAVTLQGHSCMNILLVCHYEQQYDILVT